MNRITEYLLSSENVVLRRIRKFFTRIPILQTIGEAIVYKSHMSDYQYIRMQYKAAFGEYPNLKNPQTFNEKNCWRKLYERNDYYTSLVDKYEIKRIISRKVGGDYSFNLLGVWDKPEEIDFAQLPKQFVLKTNHAGGILVCKNKSAFNQKEAIAELRKRQKCNYFLSSREWPYKNVKRKIIAEAYMGDDLTDYKNYCFGGKLIYTLVWRNHSNKEGTKPSAHYIGSYDRNWKKTAMGLNYPADDLTVEKPSCYEEMIRIAEKMAEGIPFVRVDCYILNDHPYIGEMTFFPWGGYQKFEDKQWDMFLGGLMELDLPGKKGDNSQDGNMK